MWGGCFTCKTADSLSKLNSSIDVDKRLFKEDIFASQVYAKSLLSVGILNDITCKAIINGLNTIKEEWENNMPATLEDEDIHSAVERRLKELIGPVAGCLHTGRSRNDQVATDVKLWIINNGKHLQNLLYKLIEVMNEMAKREIDVLMPGYTHLKQAYPVRFSHFILSHAWNFHSDYDLLKIFLERTKILPLGSGAIAGNPLPIDRMEMAKELGFSNITMNSMNAVGNRDSVAEFLFWSALCGVHLSRLAEDLIIFNTDEFGFIHASQEYTTGSSLLPHKRNPDGLELSRSAAAQLIGNSTTFLTTLKSLPSTYNKDLQVDKQLLFQSFDIICSILEVVEGTIKTMEVDEKRCRSSLQWNQLAIRLVYWLVKRGLAFREAHQVVGRVVVKAEEKRVPINQLSEEDRILICELLGGDLTEVWDFDAAVEEYQTTGGTSRKSVLEQISVFEDWLKQNKQ